MREYHKIQSLFLRDPATQHRTFLHGQWSMPEFEYLADLEWTFTEKVDGTNIRVGWDGKVVNFGGRTDDAQTPPFLLDRLREMFPADLMLGAFGDRGGLTLYGEGYGAKIQKGGGDYIADGQSFILFDILGESEAGRAWFEREKVEESAAALGIAAVPIIDSGCLDYAVTIAREGYKSEVAGKRRDAEGLVMRPKRELLTRRGERIIAKLKTKDFARGDR